MEKSNQTIGKYAIERELGSGSMGTVYLVYDSMLEQRRAIKVMKTGVEDEGLRKRFFLEGRSAAKLDHPNIIRIWDLNTDANSRPYIVMEYIEGEDLKTFIDQKRFLPFEQKLKIIIGVCEGLDHAHEKGVIHRDIKPGNIRINRLGEAKILDFGLARLESAAMSRTRGPIGSPYYMSPEQWRGASDLDRKSDVFSVGAVLYELIANIRPFEADDISAVMTRILSEPHVPLKEALPACSEELSAILDRALAKEPNQRFSTCLEFAQALRSLNAAIPGQRDDLKRKVIRLETELDRCQQRSAELQVRDYLDSSIFDKDGPDGRKSSVSDPDSPDEVCDYGFLLLRHASLQQRLDSLKEKLQAALPLLRLLRAAHRQFDAGHIESCQQTVQELLRASPAHPSGLRLLDACKRALEERRRREEHEAQFETLLQKTRESLDRGDFSQAFESVRRVLEIDASHAGALSLRETIRQREALRAAEKNLRTAELIEACRNRLRTGDYESALASSKDLVKLLPPEADTPGNPQSRRNRIVEPASGEG